MIFQNYIFIIYINEKEYKINIKMEGNQNLRFNTSNNTKIFIAIFLFISYTVFIICIMNRVIISIQVDYQHISNINTKFNISCFYKDLFHIFNLFNLQVLSFDILIIYISTFESIDLINRNLEKIFQSFLYFNYLFFGPILFGVVILCMKYGNEISFIYDKKTNYIFDFDYINLFFIFTYILISFTVAVICPILYSYNDLCNSIRMKRYGNYLIGYIFWSIALYSPDGNRRINFNRENNGQNDQNIQNFMMPIDNPLLFND